MLKTVVIWKLKKKAIYDEAKKLGFKIKIEYLDILDIKKEKDGISNRDALNTLLKDIKSNKVLSVIVLNRATFSMNLYEYINICKVFHENRTQVFFYDSDEPGFLKGTCIHFCCRFTSKRISFCLCI